MEMADWSAVAHRADITVFNDHVSDPDEVVTRLAPFDVIFVMRERTPLLRDIIERLPRLKMIASTGPFNASIDMAAAEERGIHMKLSERSAGLVGPGELATMKPTTLLVNTSGGPIVDEAALVGALRSRTIGAAALDVFDTEPLPAGHPLRTLDNVLAGNTSGPETFETGRPTLSVNAATTARAGGLLVRGPLQQEPKPSNVEQHELQGRAQD